jgi:cytidylate kinase
MVLFFYGGEYMAKQLIISVSREFGSGGHEIAEILAKRFDIPIYDSNLLEEIANSKNLDVDTMEKYDEKPKNVLLSRRVRGYSNSLSEVLAQMQFDYIRELANKGDSFVIVGRCAETVLKNHEALVSIFVLADMESKIARVSKHNEISRSEAEAMISMQNKKRKMYHNRYCEDKWGDSRNYDVCINSARLGVERTANVLESYIKERVLLREE